MENRNMNMPEVISTANDLFKAAIKEAIIKSSDDENKMSLKKWEIKLGLSHKELVLPWDTRKEENI